MAGLVLVSGRVTMGAKGLEKEKEEGKAAADAVAMTAAAAATGLALMRL